MILSYGVDVTDMSRERVHYRFFDDPNNEGRDAVFASKDGSSTW